jgi:hypothetical protein
MHVHNAIMLPARHGRQQWLRGCWPTLHTLSTWAAFPAAARPDHNLRGLASGHCLLHDTRASAGRWLLATWELFCCVGCAYGL